MNAGLAKGGPVRTCVGCRKPGNATEMLRVVIDTNGSLIVGRSLPGRGAWLCTESLACLTEAIRKSAFGRALRTNVGPGAEAALRTMLTSRESMEGSSSVPVGCPG